MPCSNGEESGSGALRTRDSDDVALMLSNPPILPLAAWAAKRMTRLSYACLIYDMYPDFPVALDVIPGGPSPRPGMGTGHANGVPQRRPHRGPRGLDEATAGVQDGAGFCIFHQEGRGDPKLGRWIVYRPTAQMRKPVRPRGGLMGSFALLYSGNVGRFHELRTAIDAIGVLDDRGRDDIEFLIIGEGARKEERQRYVEGVNANLVETTGEGVLPAGSFLVGDRLFQSGL